MKRKDIAIIFGALAAAVILMIAQLSKGAVTASSWGLSFSKEGQTPSGPASIQQLQALDAAFVGNTEEKVLYLTFDAGYENGYTEQILDVLKKQNVKAAFFLVGDYLERNGDLVRRMVEEGHIVGNHTASHPDMSKISDKDGFAKELKEVEDLFREITGKELPKFYRPPQGIYSQSNLEHAQALGYKTVFWSLAYADWDNNKQPTRDYAFSKLMPRTHNGAVILLHATSKTNADILDELLTTWKNQGYRFDTVERLFPSTNKSYND